MSTDSNLILCNHRQRFLRQISSLHRKLPHPLQCGKTSNSKIFTLTKTKFLKRSLILTLPLLLTTPQLYHGVGLLPLHLWFTMTRSIVLTLPLLISSHMLKLLTLVDVYLRLHHAHHPPRTASPRGHACAQTLNWNVQNFTCPKLPLTRFQF